MSILSACATGGSSVEPICNLDLATFTEAELQALSDKTVEGISNFTEEFIEGCREAGIKV